MKKLDEADLSQTLNLMKKQAILNTVKNTAKALAVTGTTAFSIWIWCLAGSTWWTALPIIVIVWYLYISSLVGQVNRCIVAIEKATQATDSMDNMVDQANALMEKYKSDDENLNN